MHKNDLFNLEVGVMRNLNQRNSIGVLYFGGYENSGQSGFRIRYRRWLRKRLSISLSPGLLKSSNHLTVNSRLLTGELNLNYHDLIIFSYRLDKIKTKDIPSIGRKRASRTQHFVGIKTGSYFGLGGAVIAGVGFLIVASSIEN